ncbi:Uncharacterised protein [Legionella quateirensis]|uniref:Uncharacterized protein n=1 Tax=Legionella quateirensis TaxID=45072 RepID=A0A378L051_9GAMM|nr:Uncharacterised protein [Legionella quateirensis]
MTVGFIGFIVIPNTVRDLHIRVLNRTFCPLQEIPRFTRDDGWFYRFYRHPEHREGSPSTGTEQDFLPPSGDPSLHSG